MSRNDLNMENLFRSQMESYSVDPSPGLWQKVHTKILWKQFLGFSFQTFNVYYLAAAISLAGVGSYALFSGPVPTENLPLMVQPERVKDHPAYLPSEETVLKQENNETPFNEKDQRGYPGQAFDAKDASGQKTEGSSEEINKQKIVKEIKKFPVLPAEPYKTQETLQVAVALKVKAAFQTNLLSGCSPLAVNFTNLSENAVQYTWTFSDGGSSSEKNPSYVFDEPGEFPVTLKVFGADGMEYYEEKTIRVYETPKALFELDEAADLLNNQPVYFYNYSRGAEYFKWDFGDDQRSDLVEPIHYYDHPGKYNVSLRVWTDKGCYDSLILQNAFTGPESEIKFPNAFAPNMSGPSGGSYYANDVYNSVFHPVVSGELIEYQLKIFNRQGVQIFESNDLAFGWDGYYQEKLATQDVYIWKARGKFSNGKTFVKSGDVTLVKQY